MKRNGFTLLELLIGISLISIVMIFLFRLLNDIQHEALSNTYITANQTSRNEIINLLDTALYENGDVCSLYIGSSVSNRLYKIGFCNNNEIDLTISKHAVKIEYDSKKYNYEMKDTNAFYETDMTYSTVTFRGKKYIKFNIKTHKKGLRDTIIDDIEIMGTVTKNLHVKRENTDEFTYIGEEQSYKVPKTGRYKIELWGAQGGDGACGGYTSGEIQLTADTMLYIYVGGEGPHEATTTNVGGYNGGGYSGNNGGTNSYGGGGATDVRLLNGDWNNASSLRSRIMVAGGGGGTFSANADKVPGVGGNLKGGDGGGNYGGAEYNGGGGQQTTYGVAPGASYRGQFGSGVQSYTSGFGGGGGGGYWGGSNGYGRAGGGGSSYISGYTGCVAVISETSNDPRLDSDGEVCEEETVDNTCSIHYSDMVFTNAVMKSGDESMPAHGGNNTTVGSAGNGYAQITYLGN